MEQLFLLNYSEERRHLDAETSKMASYCGFTYLIFFTTTSCLRR